MSLLACPTTLACQAERASPTVTFLDPVEAPATGHETAAPDALTRELRSTDPMVRYTAAAQIAERLAPSNVSADARQALLDLIANAREPEGVRLWAARAAAKVHPDGATKTFIELDTQNIAVDDDAWLILGARALPHLTSRCTPEACATTLLLKLALITSNNPRSPEARALLPVLMRETTRSEQHKAIVYRALGSFGASLKPSLEVLTTHDEGAVRTAAKAALTALE